MTAIFYPDYSSYQGAANVPAGTPAVVAKATEGTYYEDPDFGHYKASAAALNAAFSGYHFLKSDEDARAQALYYWNFAGSTPCMLDVETEGSSKPGVDEVLAFMTALHGFGGRVWGVYMPQWYWGEVGGDLSRLTAAGAVLVSSNYTTYSDSGPGWLPYGGATPTCWQYTSTPIDMNAFKGTPAELAAIITGKPVPAPTPAKAATSTEDDMSFATGVITPGMGADGKGACTVILPPPANSGAAGWGNVWFSLGSDMGDAHVRVTLFQGGAWREFNENLVVPAAAARVFPFGGALPVDVEKISITRLAGSENVSLSYLVEAVKA